MSKLDTVSTFHRRILGEMVFVPSSHLEVQDVIRVDEASPVPCMNWEPGEQTLSQPHFLLKVRSKVDQL